MREGHTRTQTTVETRDHDFPSAGDGKLIPHGIYDLARNEGYVHLNASHDINRLNREVILGQILSCLRSRRCSMF